MNVNVMRSKYFDKNVEMLICNVRFDLLTFSKSGAHMIPDSKRVTGHPGYPTPYLSVLSRNMGKYVPEQLRKRTLFTQ